MKTALYRHWDKDGVLLYVGISLSAVARLSSHISGSAWADAISRVTVEQFPNRAAAMAAEKVAIKAEKPIWNIVHNRPAKPANDNAKRLRNATIGVDTDRLDDAMKVATSLFYRWVDDEAGVGVSELEELYRHAPELAYWRRGGIINPAPSEIVHELLVNEIGWHSNDDFQVRTVM